MPALFKIITWICVMMAMPAAAQEVQLSLETQLRGESNVFRLPGSPVSDGIFRISPELKIQNQRKRLNYRLRYAPTYEQFFTTQVLSGWNHIFQGEGTYEFSPSDAVTASLSFYDVRSRSTSDLSGGDPSTDPGDGILNDNIRSKSLRAALGYRKSLSPNLSGNGELAYRRHDFEGIGSSDNQSVTGTLSMQYGVSQRFRTGFGGAGVYQDFEGTLRRPPSSTIVGRIFVTMFYSITKKTTMSLQIGPSVFNSQSQGTQGTTFDVPQYVTNPLFPDSAVVFPQCNPISTPNGPVFIWTNCPVDASTVAPLPGAIDQVKQVTYAPGDAPTAQSTRLTYFANANIRRQWKKSSIAMVYRRTDSAAAASGIGTILDYASLQGSWQILEDLSLSFHGSWSMQQSSSDVATFQALQVEGANVGGVLFAESKDVVTVQSQLFRLVQTGWQAGITSRYAITGNSSVIASYRYDDLRTEGDTLADLRTWDNHTVYIGFRYDFDPFRF